MNKFRRLSGSCSRDWKAGDPVPSAGTRYIGRISIIIRSRQPVAPCSEYKCTKCKTNSLILILTLTLKTNPNLYRTYPNPLALTLTGLTNDSPSQPRSLLPAHWTMDSNFCSLVVVISTLQHFRTSAHNQVWTTFFYYIVLYYSLILCIVMLEMLSVCCASAQQFLYAQPGKF